MALCFLEQRQNSRVDHRISEETKTRQVFKRAFDSRHLYLMV